VTQYPRRAGVSSFGFGGTNAHVVVEQRPDPVAADAVGAGSAGVVTTLVVGGKTDQRVASMAQMLAQWMTGAGAEVSLADVAHTVNHHRSRQSRFATVAACERAQAVAGLLALAAGRSAEGVVAPHQGQCRAGTVFVYSGQGSQWPGMGRQLLADEPVFAAAVDELEPIFVSEAGFSLRQVLAGGEPVTGIERIQPVLVGMGLALTKLWRSYGVHPDAVIGHSMGEVTAAVVAGALSPAEGLRVITTRSTLLARLSGHGAMALPDAPGLDSVLPELRTALAEIAPRPTRIPVIVTTGAKPVFDADYWADSLRAPVRLSQAVTVAGADYGTFVEVSPHPVLTGAISDTLGGDHHHSIGTLQRDAHDTLTFHTNLNRTHTTRPPETDHPAEPHPVVPPTPWHQTRHWMSTPEPAVRQPASHWLTITERLEAAVSAPRSGTVLGEHVTIATTPAVHLWQAWLNPDAKPYPGAYLVQGIEVVPISVLLQTLSSAAAECDALALSDVRFELAIVVDEPRVIQVVADGESVTISSGLTAESSEDRWISHASARILRTPPDVEPDIHSRTQELPEYAASSVTGSRQRWGIEGQPFEWSIDSCRSTADVFHAAVLLPEASTVALLDAAVDLARLLDASGPRLLVPVAAESVQLHTGLADARGVVEVRRRDSNGDELMVDIVAAAPDGSLCVQIRSLRYEAASRDESATVTWSQVSEEDLFSELETKLQTILARELGMPASAVAVDRPFPELGLDSTMAMVVLRETTRLVGFEVPATMLWENPTIATLAGCLAEAIAAPEAADDVLEDDVAEVAVDSPSSVLDELFDHVESAPVGSERGSL
jgi:phthiocerol/phenolphthiocerol synthesis type-I polyketide synthase A